jgi:hypothetical protein
MTVDQLKERLPAMRAILARHSLRPTCWQEIVIGGIEEHVFDEPSKIWLKKEFFRRQQCEEELKKRTPEQVKEDHEKLEKKREKSDKEWGQWEALRRAAESTRQPDPDFKILRGSFPHMHVLKFLSTIDVSVFRTTYGNWRCIVTAVNRDWDNVIDDFHSHDLAGLLVQMRMAAHDDEQMSRAMQEALPEGNFWKD